ncbi:MAG: hypothetical protein FJZ01_18925 [Candidatus Sericytochromatia bacterium]|nr:hypothetical protein [Candidatus Tanganyikabacteria bacterium]
MGKAKSGELVWQGSESGGAPDSDLPNPFESLDLSPLDPCLPDVLGQAESLLDKVAGDSAGMALYTLGQLGDHLDLTFDLTEDLIRIRERRAVAADPEEDAVLANLGRVQSELLRCKDELQSGLAALAPGVRDASRALGMADSVVARLDLLVSKVEEVIEYAQAAGADETLVGGLERTAEELLQAQQEAAAAFLEIFEATW